MTENATSQDAISLRAIIEEIRRLSKQLDGKPDAVAVALEAISYLERAVLIIERDDAKKR